MKADRRFSADELLLDRQILDVDGLPVGKVDDLELSEPDDGGPPVLIAVLTGPLALGPRIGGRLGEWWAAAGRRLRPNDDPRPNRIPITQVEHCDRTELKLRVSRDRLDADRLRDWTRDHIIGPIPGSGRGRSAS
ncbi:hypothetical protein [Mycobacterium sp.]|uniref:hypothetical protein n=1 Tax=Mycobacterium sp. TaxID=1785 RepID=UPI0026104F12|nr:hypothetical protein [Mycobacterium sp.]